MDIMMERLIIMLTDVMLHILISLSVAIIITAVVMLIMINWD